MKILRYIILVLCFAPLTWAAQSELVGQWKSKDGSETQVYTAGGRFSSIASAVGVQGRYECQGDTLVLHCEGDGAPPKIVMKFKIKGDTLRLENQTTHEVAEMRRVNEKRANSERSAAP